MIYNRFFHIECKIGDNLNEYIKRGPNFIIDGEGIWVEKKETILWGGFEQLKISLYRNRLGKWNKII